MFGLVPVHQVEWIDHQQMRVMPVRVCERFVAADHQPVGASRVIGERGEDVFPFGNSGSSIFSRVHVSTNAAQPQRSNDRS